MPNNLGRGSDLPTKWQDWLFKLNHELNQAAFIQAGLIKFEPESPEDQRLLQQFQKENKLLSTVELKTAVELAKKHHLPVRATPFFIMTSAYGLGLIQIDDPESKDIELMPGEKTESLLMIAAEDLAPETIADFRAKDGSECLEIAFQELLLAA